LAMAKTVAESRPPESRIVAGVLCEMLSMIVRIP